MSSSFKAYEKINAADQERLNACRKARKRLAIITFCSIVLTGVIVLAIVVGVSRTNARKSGANPTTSSTLRAVCDETLYPDSCYSSLAPLVKSGKIQPEDIYKLSVQVARDELSSASSKLFDDETFKNVTDEMTAAAIDGCHELLSLALFHLNNSLAPGGDFPITEAFDDLRTWLSASQTFQQTCIDGFDDALSSMASLNLKNSSEYNSNSLAIISIIANSIDSIDSFGQKRRLMMSFVDDDNEAPNWLSSKDRKLLQTNSSDIEADTIVARDGSGNYTNISAALMDVPDRSKKRYVIYVKEGMYVENVRVDVSKWNVMLIGDGMNATMVSSNLSFADGTPTFRTATLGKFHFFCSCFSSIPLILIPSYIYIWLNL